jgi:hypothetical protein
MKKRSDVEEHRGIDEEICEEEEDRKKLANCVYCL